MRRAALPSVLAVVGLLLASGCANATANGPPSSTPGAGTAPAPESDDSAPVVSLATTPAPQEPAGTVVPSSAVEPAPDSTASAGVGPNEQRSPDDATAPTTAVFPPCNETQGRLQRFTYNSEVMRLVHPVEAYNVYTPPCYERDATRRYPTIWLLHGAQRDENQWVNLGLIDTANQMIVSGEIPPVIIILGDGIYAQGEYTAPPGTMVPFDYYLLNELKPRVQNVFRTLNHRAYRAIGGISRGGEWALLVAGRYPDVFGAAGGHSPAVGSPTNPGPVLAPQLAGKNLRIWLDVGTSDSLFANVASLDASLNQMSVPRTYQPAPGGHDESYWASRTADYLRWYTEPWKAGSGG